MTTELIRLTRIDTDGTQRPLYVNPAYIQIVAPSHQGAVIEMHGYVRALKVAESPETIAAMVLDVHP